MEAVENQRSNHRSHRPWKSLQDSTLSRLGDCLPINEAKTRPNVTNKSAASVSQLRGAVHFHWAVKG